MAVTTNRGGSEMIVRTWRALTTSELEPQYLEQVRAVVMPHLHSFSGYRGAQFAKRSVDGQVEILVMTYWESMEAVRAFAGSDEVHAYMPPEIAATLLSFDATSDHYEVLLDDSPV
jgi:heme-degrading monooxygenase HmoA